MCPNRPAWPTDTKQIVLSSRFFKIRYNTYLFFKCIQGDQIELELVDLICKTLDLALLVTNFRIAGSHLIAELGHLAAACFRFR